jgi:hypothetical protein
VISWITVELSVLSAADQYYVRGSDMNHLSTLFPVPAGQVLDMSLKQNEIDLQIPLIHKDPGVVFHVMNL